MGGWFSSKRREPPPRVYQATRPTTSAPNIPAFDTSYPSYYHQPARQPTSQAVVRVQPWNTGQTSSHINQPAYRPTLPQHRVSQTTVFRLPLAPAVYKESALSHWDKSSLPHNESFRLVNLSEYDIEFAMVREAFQGGAKGKHFKVTKVERVENPFLFGCYLLKKEEMSNRNGFVEQEIHFHGTKKRNVKQICENNFNWKLHGDSTGNRFGKGVSFSPISYYASHYSDKNDSEKVMFYVTVLVSRSVVGNKNMELPPKLSLSSNSRYDTAVKEDSRVTVKFCDNEFYPEFIIHYTTPISENATATAKPKKSQEFRQNYQPQPSYSYDSCADDSSDPFNDGYYYEHGYGYH